MEVLKVEPKSTVSYPDRTPSTGMEKPGGRRSRSRGSRPGSKHSSRATSPVDSSTGEGADRRPEAPLHKKPSFRRGNGR